MLVCLAAVVFAWNQPQKKIFDNQWTRGALFYNSGEESNDDKLQSNVESLLILSPECTTYYVCGLRDGFCPILR